MDIDVVDPALRAATKKLPSPRVGNPIMRRVVRIAVSRLPLKDTPGATVRTVKAGGAEVHVYEPAELTDEPTGTAGDTAGEGAAASARPALLWIHGGGFVIGSWRQDHRLCAETARALGITVVSVEYRLAPEHPFPVPLDDAWAAWQWLRGATGELGVDPGRLAVGGESAGAGLAACLVQRIRDESPVQPVAQWLFAPMLDDRTAADRSLDAVGHWIWDNAANRVGWDAYLDGVAAPGAVELPAYAAGARRAELAGLPPAWIGVGDIELFRAEDEAYAQRLRAAGVPAELDLVPGAPHGFESWATDTEPAQALLARARAWLATALGVSA